MTQVLSVRAIDEINEKIKANHDNTKVPRINRRKGSTGQAKRRKILKKLTLLFRDFNLSSFRDKNSALIRLHSFKFIGTCDYPIWSTLRICR
jgi:hypothetical protein